MVRDYSEKDFKEISSWWRERGMPVPPEDSLPTFGLISPRVAAGFLIVCDCNLGILEFFITNPATSRDERSAALDEISKELIKYGKAIGVTNFKCDTEIGAIAGRAEKHGFRYVGNFSTWFLNTRSH